MTKVVCIEPDGHRVELDIKDGWSVMQGAVTQGVQGVVAECGGSLSCATCHCYVDEAWYPRLAPPSDSEQVMLENVAAERLPTSRLSCQIEVQPGLDGLTIRYPDRQI
ncbi:MAG TPA: 2Fe-2S iron-sulfur cluster-binding protein [Steroidobacteraceae bacterium]|nr:2Fe-2S iron-sulfur cluster-binding protein [Steroidobacteraceae bacterium]